MTERFRDLWETLLPIGRDPAGAGWVRYAWSPADLACREWFATQASARGMALETDGNGNMFAWWGSPEAGDAVATGSHFDSVPHGGAYDGPLGIVCAFLAVDVLRERGVTPVRPLAVVAFAEEEGGRFGVPCLGSRLLTGALDPVRARALTDRDGRTLAEVMLRAGADPDRIGADGSRLGRLSSFVELHVEQGVALVERAAPVGVASVIWPHGRWRLEFAGQGNHAGTTRMSDRRDPMLTAAYTVLAANEEARTRGAHATVGRVEVAPNATNAVPATVTAWLDARAADAATLDGLVAAVGVRARERAEHDGTSLVMAAESVSPLVDFDRGLRDRLVDVLGDAPVLPTGAGHDAGVLAAHVPTAMLFVRNPTGISHAPAESATDADCAAGVRALADVLEALACR